VTRILVVSGSPRARSHSRVLARELLARAGERAEAELLDLAKPHLEPFRGYDETYGETVQRALDAVTRADVLLLVCPIYNSLLSGAVKNLFEFVDYKALEGKVAGLILMSGGKISHLQVQGQLVALMHYFRIVTNPRAVYVSRGSFDEGLNLKDERVRGRLHRLVDETLALAAGLGDR
jgi:NAD(P)H-dependent FMN reductase